MGLKARPKILQYRRTAGRWLPVALCFFLLPGALSAQLRLPHNRRDRVIANIAGPIVLDSLSIAAGSFFMEGVDTADYRLDPASATLSWVRKPVADSLRIGYRALPLSFVGRFFHKDPRLIDSHFAFSYVPAPGSSGSGAFVDFNTVEYTGSYGRSISVGNSQDAALSSHFNLQAGGYLPDSIRIEAAISDNSMPFQPEGNTQRLQEFDQVYIRLSKGRHQLQLGDYNLERPAGYFMNFNKRVQGLYFSSGFRAGKGGENSYGLSGSIAKGEFARNIFNGLEGNQGPYKLAANNGEQFFIVLAGTEQVFVNGALQERGEDADYTINYNTAEIRFMPRRLISKDSRIQATFEYQSRNYLNSLLYAWDEFRPGKRWLLRMNVYSNQDAKNQGYQQSLSGEQKRFLSTIGDSISRAYFPLVVTDTFAAGRILYKRIDTVVNGWRYDSVFVYSSNPDSARYSVSFSFMGAGKGDYVISGRAANGRVYDWLPRIGGQPQGEYAPVQLLITPKNHQMYTLSSSYRIDSMKEISAELGASNYDPNLFSAAGGAAHAGLAAKVRYSERRHVGRRDSAGAAPWQLQNEASYEFVQDRFRAIAPYRSIEFGRDWNVPQVTETDKADEHLAGYSGRLSHRSGGAAGYAFSYYKRGLSYSGYRNQLSYDLNRERFRLSGSLNLLHARDTFRSSRFFRPSALAEYRLPHSFIGAAFQQEDNRIAESYSDVLRNDAYRFTIASAYFRSARSGASRYNLSYARRTDELPRANAFVRQSHSHTVDAQLAAGSKNHQFTFTGAYRRLAVDDTVFNNQRDEETGLGRLEYGGSLLRGALRLQTLYETGAGQEQKRSYTYVEVPAGQGVYTWVDYNGNGIQEANEFETALYPDQKRFIKIFTPGNEYVKVHYATLNQSISIDLSAYFGGGTNRLRKFASHFSDEGSLQITNRLTNTGGLEAMNPFIPVLRDDRVIIAGTSVSNAVFFNRNSTVWGLDYTYLHNSGKQLLTYGVEGQSQEQQTGRLRWNLSPVFNMNITARRSLRAYESALTDGRSYAVSGRSGEPSLTWMHRGLLRITGSVRYEERRNGESFGGEGATIRRADLECRYSKPVSGVLILRGGYAGIQFDGLLNSPVAFTMLDALQPGSNFLWYLSWDRRLSKGIELSFEYEGRQPGAGSVIHTGRMSVRAML